MKTVAAMVFGLTLVIGFRGGAAAGGKDKVKLDGLITCCKCNFKAVKEVNPDAEKPAKCVTIMIAKDKDKKTIYIFDAASHKKYHGDICTEPKEGTVSGTVTKDGKKLILAVDELKYK